MVDANLVLAAEQARQSSSDAASPDEDGQPPNRAAKKRRAPEARMNYPRKRAVTACQLCRGRKTKCDNQRPSCGTCLSLEVHCSYQDRTSNDLSTFDPASLAILDRLNTAVQLLENQAHLPNLVENLIALSRSNSMITSPTANSLSTFTSTALPTDAFSPTQVPPDNSTTLEEALRGPGNFHDILEWPIFKSKFNSEELTASFYDQDDESQTRQGDFTRSMRISEEDAPILVEYFLQHVHTKNPILDPPKLIAMAKEVAEEGFKWDGTSCLVLITCGLANLATQFSVVTPISGDSSIRDSKDYNVAEAYYTAARKRTGLLNNSVLAVQAMFLLGVFEMYSLRPLRAWLSFNHACTIFQTYLHTSSRHGATRATIRLEQRLFWSCLKSECEMRDEVQLPPSGLAKVNHPDVFPSPPGGSPEAETVGNAILSPTTPRYVGAEFQKSWYYYLSEIASRRLKNRISICLYDGSPLSWQLASLPKLSRLAEELDNQVQRWAEHIPGFIDNICDDTTDELTFMLVGRYLDMQELICRPFLFLVTHSEPFHNHSPITLTYAKRAVDLVIKFSRHLSIKHRHHGTWYGGRLAYTKSLILLAAVQSQRIAMPDNTIETLRMTLDFLKYWEAEAPDLGVARRILSTLYDETIGDLQGVQR